MIIDKETEMASEQAVTASAAGSTVIDQVQPGDAIDQELYFVVLCIVAAASAGGAATVQFALQTATDAAFTTPVTLYESGAIAQADLVAGAKPVTVRVPRGAKRYLRAYFTVSGGPLTAGKFSALLTQNA